MSYSTSGNSKSARTLRKRSLCLVGQYQTSQGCEQSSLVTAAAQGTNVHTQSEPDTTFSMKQTASNGIRTYHSQKPLSAGTSST